MISLASCRVTRKEVEATLWLNNSPIPAEICAREPALRKYGFYRQLDDSVCIERRLPPGCKEFVSFCKLEARKWIAIYDADLQRLLERLGEAEINKCLESYGQESRSQ